jgi:hypothetical protein
MDGGGGNGQRWRRRCRGGARSGGTMRETEGERESGVRRARGL